MVEEPFVGGPVLGQIGIVVSRQQSRCIVLGSPPHLHVTRNTKHPFRLELLRPHQIKESPDPPAYHVESPQAHSFVSLVLPFFYVLPDPSLVPIGDNILSLGPSTVPLTPSPAHDPQFVKRLAATENDPEKSLDAVAIGMKWRCRNRGHMAAEREAGHDLDEAESVRQFSLQTAERQGVDEEHNDIKAGWGRGERVARERGIAGRGNGAYERQGEGVAVPPCEE